MVLAALDSFGLGLLSLNGPHDGRQLQQQAVGYVEGAGPDSEVEDEGQDDYRGVHASWRLLVQGAVTTGGHAARIRD